MTSFKFGLQHKTQIGLFGKKHILTKNYTFLKFRVFFFFLVFFDIRQKDFLMLNKICNKMIHKIKGKDTIKPGTHALPLDHCLLALPARKGLGEFQAKGIMFLELDEGTFLC